MLNIDGGAGGGQLVRTALSLSALTGRAIRVERVREGRSTPGLRPQHLAAVRALAAITDAETEGAEVGSTTLSFRPSAVSPGRYEVDVGTAGSVTLVFDAVLPLATAVDGQLTLSARGGTDVRWAPSLDYLRLVKLPLLRRFGLAAAVDVVARGFYPVGGGEAVLSVGPSSLDRIEVPTPSGPAAARVLSVATEDLAGRAVAERQAETAVSGLEEADVAVVQRRTEHVEAASPGSTLTVRLDRGGCLAGADALGERGKPAEEVGSEAVESALGWFDGGAAVDRHMADQLLVYLGQAGGSVTCPAVTDHVRTSLPVLECFGYPVTMDEGQELPVLRA